MLASTVIHLLASVCGKEPSWVALGEKGVERGMVLILVVLILRHGNQCCFKSSPSMIMAHIALKGGTY